MTWLAHALTAALLTSFLPIVTKRLLADTPVAVVAWGINALSLPLLGLAALALAGIPGVDVIFWLGILASAALNLVATLLSTWALKLGDASLVAPVLTFNPVVTLLVAFVTLGEVPSLGGLAGVALILAGAYLLSLEPRLGGWWRPFATLLARPPLAFALAASLVWGLTPIAEKLAIGHTRPADPALVAFGSTALMAIFLIPLTRRGAGRPLSHIAAHRRGFAVAALIAGVAPLFGFSAIALGLVGYVTAIFKLSTVFSVLWAFLLLRERPGRPRVAGAMLMVLGALAIGA
jgi:uncharacterized membrane protein